MLILRPATLADSDFLWRLRNDPFVRQWMKNQSEVPLETHRAWLQKRLQDPTSCLLIACHDQTPVGQFRADANGEVSVSIAPEFRGRGLASEIIKGGSETSARILGLPQLKAHVKKENHASIRAFEKAGYRLNRSFTENAESFVELLFAMSARRK